jgi:glycosyltransferase involved in cell wall biosynthesis
MTKNKPRLCIVGNLLGKNHGCVTTQGQIIAERLVHDQYEIIAVSSRINIFARVLDIIWTILRNFRKIDVAIVEIYSGRAFFVAEIATILTRVFHIPSILVFHGGNLPEFAALYQRRVNRVIGRSQALVAPSKFLSKKFARIGVELQVIPNVIDLNGYVYRRRAVIHPKLLWMRSFHEIYNPQMALEAFAVIRSRIPEATLVMAGVDKGLEPEIKRMAEEMGLQEAVRFPGVLGPDEKIAEFSKANIYLNTNHIDNMPVSVIEACAMGLPVVATSVGGIPDMIENGHNGLLVPDGDAAAMAEAVISLIEDPELAEKLSQNGRLLAERSSWENVRPDWEKLFDEIMNTKDSRAKTTASTQVSN